MEEHPAEGRKAPPSATPLTEHPEATPPIDEGAITTHAGRSRLWTPLAWGCLGSTLTLLGVALLVTFVLRQASCSAKSGPPLPQPHAKEALFPWPPSMPSAYYKMPLHFLRPARTLGDVADRLERALNRAGYTENKFYRVYDPNNSIGFAIVTQIENINPDATPRSTQRRSIDSPVFTMRDLIRALISGQRGLYRALAFTVTTSTAGFSPADSETEFKLIFAEGDTSLSSTGRDLPFTSEYNCLALIYEFSLGDVPPPSLNLPSEHTGEEHLVAARIMQGLEH